MKKKEIEKIPFRGGVRADKQYRNTAVAFLQDIRGENHLFVEVYENKKQELQTPWIRMVFTQKDWGLYYPDAGVWSAAGLDEEREKIGSNCKKRDNRCYMARSQGDMVWKFTGDTWERKYTTWVGALQSLIYNIKAQRVQKREDKRADRLKEREQNTPPLPKGLEDWAKKTGIGTEHFLYYKRHGRYVCENGIISYSGIHSSVLLRDYCRSGCHKAGMLSWGLQKKAQGSEDLAGESGLSENVADGEADGTPPDSTGKRISCGKSDTAERSGRNIEIYHSSKVHAQDRAVFRM